ncbi:MAG TPA: GNAT family N-acetyltransferase, partial [Mycobacterium sp.]|nr:GNAT family N-acetyltransferase [Mycobacterium sp.]
MAECLPERIAGPRLLLRPPVLDDAGALFQRIARDRQVTEYLLWTPHPDVAATRRVITERLNVEDHARTWVIALPHSDEIIGMISGRLSERHSVEIGYCIGRRWWGKGLMSEALDML